MSTFAHAFLTILLVFGLAACRTVPKGPKELEGKEPKAVDGSVDGSVDEADEAEARVELRFEGNEALSDRALRRAAVDELADFSAKGQRRSQSDDAAFSMERAYREEGFAFASVSDRVERSDSSVLLTFSIDEGPQVFIESVNVQGITFFDEAGLIPLFEREGRRLYVDSRVRSAVSAIERLYLSNGFRDMEVVDSRVDFSENRELARIVVRIKEGPRSIVRRVEFTGDMVASVRTELLAAGKEQEGMPFFARRLLELEGRVRELYGNAGYPQAKLDADVETNRITGDVRILAKIDSGPRIRISGIRVRSEDGEDLRTQEWFIRRRMVLRPGSFFSIEQERESFRELFRSGLFSKITFRLVEVDPDKAEIADGKESGSYPDSDPEIEDRVIEVGLQELQSQEISTEFGWGSYELLRGEIGFRDRNVFGSGRILDSTIFGSLRSYGANVTLTDPFFLGTDLEASLPVSIINREEASFVRRELSASLLVNKQIGKNLELTVGYSYEVTDIDRLEFEPEEIGLDEVYNLASLKFRLTHDTRNDLFLPSSGFRSNLSLDYADSAIGSEVDLFRVTVGTRFFVSVLPETVLAFRYRTGFVIPIHDQDAIPVGERYFNGGGNTVRSFLESELGPRSSENEPVGGEAFNVLSAEVRQRVYGALAMRLFADYGNVSPNKTRFQRGETAAQSRGDLIDTIFDEYFEDFRAALGVGVDYLLPIGPLRLDFAWNPDPRRDRDEDGFRVHFSLGMAF